MPNPSPNPETRFGPGNQAAAKADEEKYVPVHITITTKQRDVLDRMAKTHGNRSKAARYLLDVAIDATNKGQSNGN